MNGIKNISINNNYIDVETNKGNIVSIPIKDNYSHNLFSKAYADTKNHLKDINYYNKCADISLFPIWASVGFLLAGYITKFPLMDMLLIGCGGMTALSLASFGIFKATTKYLNNKVCNNIYWNELYYYSLNGNKKNTKSVIKKVKKNNISEYSMKKDKIIQDIPIKKENNTYHLSNNQIIQDEIIHHKNR